MIAPGRPFSPLQTAISTSRAVATAASMTSVLKQVPFRMFTPSGLRLSSLTRFPVSSASSRVAGAFLVNWFQQSTPPYQAHAPVPILREQPLRKVLLMDDLSLHGIDHPPVIPAADSGEPSPLAGGRTHTVIGDSPKRLSALTLQKPLPVDRPAVPPRRVPGLP